MPTVLRSLTLAFAWLLAAGAVLATLGPLDWRPSIGHPDLERFAAYVTLAVAFGLAYPNHRRWGVVALLAAACLLEAGQLLAPHRDARVHDAAVKMAGVVAGGVALFAAEMAATAVQLLRG